VQSQLWLDAVLKHLDTLENRFKPDSWGTVYIGGGTPSLLPSATLQTLLGRLGSGLANGTSQPTEWTFEINPEDATHELLDLLHDHGVNRLSVGGQSLEQDARSRVSRRGDAISIKRHLDLIADSWKGQLSVDMMYGLPGQTMDGLCNDLRFVADLGVSHISLYELTLETGTPLWKSVQSSLVELKDADECADQFESASRVLDIAGFERYEVSNWAISGHECKHNSVYWSMGDWCAIGPSGVGNFSMPDGSYLRIENTRNNDDYYLEPVESSVETRVSGIDAEFEFLMTSLRTKTGFNAVQFKSRFGLEAPEVFGNLPEELPAMVHGNNEAWRATEQGMDMLNSVLVHSLLRAEKFHGIKADKKGGRIQ
jgi:oxygen-independent coproporphyrinogen-3 oxidase